MPERLRKHFDSLSDARSWRAESYGKLRRREVRPPSAMTFGERAARWLPGGRSGFLLALAAGSFAFTTAALAAAPETPVTEPATGVTATEATLNGELNPGAPATTGFFFTYNTNGTCTEFGQTEIQPEQTGQAIKVTTTPPLTGLEPNREYTFCVVATHLEGETHEQTSGATQSFKTRSAPPAVDGEAPIAVNSTSATLAASINPNNEATIYTFEYSTRATGETLEGPVVKLPSGEIPAEFGDRSAVSTTKTLQAGTTYHYRVLAENGTVPATSGAVQSFTTVPTPATDPVEDVTASSATFKGHFTLSENPAKTASTQYSFLYNVGEECAGAFQTSVEEAGEGSTQDPVTVPDAELQPNKEYTVCLLTRNAFGSQLGPRVHFTTVAIAPTVGEEAVTAGSLSASAASLEAKVNPNNDETSYLFEYATDEALLGTSEAKTIAGEPALAAAFEEVLAGPTALSDALSPETTYFYRVVATNGTGSTDGATQSFTTFSVPVLTTNAAQGIGRTSATLSGSVNPFGTDTTFHYAYIDDAGYRAALAQSAPNPYAEGVNTPETPVGSDSSVHATNPLQVSELTPGTTYHYALIATNTQGVAVIGPDVSFTTASLTGPVATTGEPAERRPVLRHPDRDRRYPRPAEHDHLRIRLRSRAGVDRARDRDLPVGLDRHRAGVVRDRPAGRHDLLLPRHSDQPGWHQPGHHTLLHDRHTGRSALGSAPLP